MISVAILLVPLNQVTAQRAKWCADGVTPQFAPSLAALQHALGDVMGVPAGCPQVDAEGDTVQATTTGLAVYRSTGMALFAAGDIHWALTPDGLETWTGNWHNGFDPPVTPSVAADVQDAPTLGSLASIQALTLVSVAHGTPQTLMVQDERGSRYTVETDSGCPEINAALGQYVYVRSIGSQSDLILLEPAETCAVTSMEPAAHE